MYRGRANLDVYHRARPNGLRPNDAALAAAATESHAAVVGVAQPAVASTSGSTSNLAFAPRFDANTGQPIPKFDPDTGAQNW